MKLVVVTPAGREKYMRLLSRYVLGSCEVDEWQLWDNCRNPEDRAFVHRLAESDPRCELKTLDGADGGWSIIGSFFRFCDDRDALYLRLDDDIVYLEPDFFAKFRSRALAERGGPIWFSPLVVNNAICNTLLKHFSDVDIEGPLTAQAMCPRAWAYPNFPQALHPVLIEAVKTGRLKDFRVPDREVRMARFSINAVGFFGADRVELGDLFMPPGCTAEEEWLSAVLPAKIDRPGKIFGDLLVAHFSFYTQERGLLRTDLLDAYCELAGMPAMPYKRPRVRLKEWIRALRGKKRGPDYRISLKSTGKQSSAVNVVA